MTKTIKDVILKEVAELQAQGQDKLNRVQLATMLMKLQSRIMVNISVGRGVAQTTLPYKCKDGQI
jgi:hypothetical protein